MKRPSRSICQVKRSGRRRACGTGWPANASMAGDGARGMVSVAGGMVSRGRLIGCGRFGKRIEQRKLGGRFARLCRLLIIGSRLRRDRLLDHGRDGCARLRQTGSDETGSDKGGSDDAAAGCISSSDCACASRGAISAILPAAIRTPWLPSGKSNREAAAGRKPAERRAKSLQALQPDGAAREQPACEPRDLPPVPVGRPEGFFGKGCGTGGAEQRGRRPALAHRIRVPSAVHSQAGRRLAA